MSDGDDLHEQHFDVIVIGAGIAGAMSAFLSAQAGFRTLLVDRQRFPRHKVCGCCLNGRAVQMLKDAGLEASLRSLHPSMTRSLAIRCGGRQLDLAMPENVAVSRHRFDQWLVDQAVTAGCRFLDDVTAIVEPLASETSSPHLVAAVSLEGHSKAQQTEETPEERSVLLQVTNPVTRETAGGALGEVAASSDRSSRAWGRVVLVCDGLGHPSLTRLDRFQAPARRGSRIGLGAVFPRTPADGWINSDEILMAVSPHGYAGVVEIEDRQLNLAAAIDPSHLHRTKSPLESLRSIFLSAGVPMPSGLSEATIKGTLPLTRSATRICGHRLFLLGDSTGYVEPFTGEGMAWALTAATAVVPLVTAAVRQPWSNELMTQWQTVFRGIVGREQKICRLLSAALRRPWMLPPILTTCRFFPSMTRHLVHQINRVPEALDTTR